MNFLLRFFLFVVLAAVVAGAAALFWISDTERLKPELERLVNQNSEYELKLHGDVKWQIFGNTSLELTDIELFDKRDTTIKASELYVHVDLAALWRDLDRWEIKGFALNDTEVLTPSGTALIRQFTLTNFAENQATPFYVDGQYLADQQAQQTTESAVESGAGGGEEATSGVESTTLDLPIDGTAKGFLTYTPQADGTIKVQLSNTRIDSNVASGDCTVNIIQSPTQASQLVTTDDDILPLDTLSTTQLDVSCDLEQVSYNGETFEQIDVEVVNVDHQLDVTVASPQFFSGTMNLEVIANYENGTPAWMIEPNIQNIDMQRFLSFTQGRLQWIAQAGLDGQMTMSGNTEAQLFDSVKAQTSFASGEGQINITKIKQQLLRIAALTGKAEDVQSWPDIWDYENFSGNWLIDGENQDLQFAIDHMTVEARGKYNYENDQLDMLGYITVATPKEGSPFKINPLLVDTPIPVRCVGPSADPSCRVDPKAAQKIVAQALTGDSDSGLRRKLDEKIEEKVPEEYKDLARGLLDLLGNSLD